jgi:DNA ligase (NAD+)
MKKDKNYCVRGELVISKKNFIKYGNKFTDARNMVSGIIHSK